MKHPVNFIITAVVAAVGTIHAQAPEQPVRVIDKGPGGHASRQVNGMQVNLVSPASFPAGAALVFTLKLKNVSERELSFQVVDGIGGKNIGSMKWELKDVKNDVTWQAVANPNPGPEPGMPMSMEIKTLKPGESLDIPVRVLRWGQMFATQTQPVRQVAALPAGTYVASVTLDVASGVSVAGKPATNWKGHATLRSARFDVTE